MPGGIARAMRMIPALVAIAEDIARLCPNALYINYANPMTVNCWAIRKATGVNVIGLCHGVHDVTRELAALIGAPPHEVTSLGMGVNHFTWLYDLRWNGVDAWPLVRKNWQAIQRCVHTIHFPGPSLIPMMPIPRSMTAT
ncbi:MAG: hypothetical protein R2932_54870 [Caldilineaceae bacterium]